MTSSTGDKDTVSLITERKKRAAHRRGRDDAAEATETVCQKKTRCGQDDHTEASSLPVT